MRQAYTVQFSEAVDSVNALADVLDSLSKLEKFEPEHYQELIIQFLECVQDIDTLLEELYHSHYSHLQAPEEERKTAVLAEFVEDKKLSQERFVELTEIDILVAYFNTLGLIEIEEDDDIAFYQESFHKIPTSYPAMYDLLSAVEAPSLKPEAQ